MWSCYGKLGQNYEINKFKMKKITVLGSGSFGTALGVVLAKNNHNVMILSRSPEVAESINSKHINPKYFSNYTLPSNLVCSSIFLSTYLVYSKYNK